MAIEIIPKRKIKVPSREDILFYFSIFFLVFSLVSFLGLERYQRRLFQTLQDLKQTLAKEKTGEQIKLEQKVFSEKERMEIFSPLFSLHRKPTNLFEVLENTVHPKVSFSGLELRNQRAEISGKAENFSALGQQIYLMEKEKWIEKVEPKNVRIGKKGGVEFTIEMVLNPKIFR